MEDMIFGFCEKKIEKLKKSHRKQKFTMPIFEYIIMKIVFQIIYYFEPDLRNLFNDIYNLLDIYSIIPMIKLSIIKLSSIVLIIIYVEILRNKEFKKQIEILKANKLIFSEDSFEKQSQDGSIIIKYEDIKSITVTRDNEKNVLLLYITTEDTDTVLGEFNEMGVIFLLFRKHIPESTEIIERPTNDEIFGDIFEVFGIKNKS